MSEIFKKDENYVYEGEPEQGLNIEKEAEDRTEGLVFDAERLSEIMLELGERMMGVEMYDFQKEILIRLFYSILKIDGAEITVLISRQAGKSEVIAFSAVTLGILMPIFAKIFPKELGHYKNGIKMGIIAPQLDQVETVYSRCMERLSSDIMKKFMADPDIGDELLSRAHFKLKNGSSLKAQSGARQSKIESKSYSLIYLDESQDLDKEKVRRSIIPMAAATYGTIVRFGTPNRTKGDFFYTIQNNKNYDRRLLSKEKKYKRLHFEYDYKAVIASKKKQHEKDGKQFHLLYEKAIERDRRNMGEHSDEFRMSYKIEWLHEVGMFVTEDFLDTYVYDKRMTFPSVDEGKFVVAGLDIASARASTVLTFGMIETPAQEYGDRPRKTLLGWVELEGTNYDEQIPILMDEILKHRVRILYADYTGVGKPVVDLLMFNLAGRVDVVPYVFTPVSKSNMWKRLEEDMMNERFRVPAHRTIRETKEWRRFNEQMLNLQKYWRGSYLVCEKLPGFNDDYCDSAALMNLAGNHLYVPAAEMEVVDNFFFGNGYWNEFRRKNRW